MARRADKVWRFPASGFAAAALAASWPGSPLGPGRWPAHGAFGAFTWVAWFVAAGVATTLLALAVALARGRGRGKGRARVAPGRVASAALAFGLLAVSAFTAAARADRIERRPLAALALAVAGLVGLRAVAAQLKPHDASTDAPE